jgi:hypothetical protein
MNRFIHFFKQKLSNSHRGQSLVETAIIAPILILMFIGVFEVGWALRGYLVLANMNRESARYAAKTGKLDFASKNPGDVGYEEVLSHTTASLAQQLPLEFLGPDPNASMILSHFVIDTGFPCISYTVAGNPVVPYQFDAASCDCTNGDPTDPDGDGTPWFSDDDLIAFPDVDQPNSRYPHYVQSYGITQTTRLGGGNFGVLAQQLALENNQLNCSILKTGSLAETSDNNVIIVETFYEQPQLLGVPVISNRFTDPVPFYTYTAMRIAISKEAQTSDTVGPVCELYPITFAKQHFATLGTDADNPLTNTLILTLREDNGVITGTDVFNWVAWNQFASGNVNYLASELVNPRLALNDFTDLVDGPGDDRLNTMDFGPPIEIDRVASHPPTLPNFGGNQIGNLMEDLDNRTIQVPVYDNATGNIEHIAILDVTSVITTGNRQITGRFQRYNDPACQ